MFRREAHRRVVAVLRCLRTEVLAGCGFLFGGGDPGSPDRPLSPGVRPDWSPVSCLAPEDCFAEKLLANSDRWADRQVLSRDLLDLAALRASWGPIPETAWSKAEAAYRSAPLDDLRKALAALERDPEYRDRCLAGLAIEDPTRLLAGLEELRRDVS
jgi:Nucleotidyl transferase AbiEii toxin, Type IV TA system